MNSRDLELAANGQENLEQALAAQRCFMKQYDGACLYVSSDKQNPNAQIEERDVKGVKGKSLWRLRQNALNNCNNHTQEALVINSRSSTLGALRRCYQSDVVARWLGVSMAEKLLSRFVRALYVVNCSLSVTGVWQCGLP
jgi:hypothetical protein